MDSLFTDLNLALRRLAKSPSQATIVAATLALGLGASTATFSVVNGVVLQPLPYPQAERLMQVRTVFANGSAGNLASYPDYEDLREQNDSFTGLAAYAESPASAVADGRANRVSLTEVSPGFLSVLGVEPALGRALSADEERAGERVAVVSYGYWQSRLGGREDFARTSIRMNDGSYAVIGVMPPSYDFPAGTDLWVPVAPGTRHRTAHGFLVVGRLRDDVSAPAAQQELSAIAQRLKQQYGDDEDMVAASVRPVLEQLVGGVRPALLLLLGASGVLLLVACVNAANLMLARALARDRESALRLALGARPARLVRDFLAESLVLSFVGGALGLAVAHVGVPALLALDAAKLPRIRDIGVDLRVFAFALVVCVLVALTVGAIPALRAVRRDPRDALAESQRIHGGGAATRHLRGGLVVAQISLTVVLLIGAGLIGRSVLRLLEEDPGYRTDGALVMDLWLPAEQIVETRTEASPGDLRIAGFLGRLLDRLATIPGVEHVGGVNRFPLETGPANGTYIVLNRPDEVRNIDDWARLTRDRARTGNAQFRVASPGYFGAMGIPLVRGRLFEERDALEAPHVALVSASLASARWPGEDPLGKLIQFGGMDGDLRPFTIVGIVGDVQDFGIGSTARPTFYGNYAQRPRSAYEFHVVLQGHTSDAAVAAAARAAAREIDPQVPVAFRTLREIVVASLADRQLVLRLLAVFGALALVLATTGVYSVVSYMALQRTREIGVRIALGARHRDVVRLLVRQGAAFAAGGIAIGLAVAFVSTRVLARWLYGVGSVDPATFSVVAVALLVAALVASLIPAYRASRRDATEALRHE
jgi:putative ABC transport system permease protein